MKHGTVILFRHPFGQMLEDNVEPPDPEDITQIENEFMGLNGLDKDSLEYKISCNACCRVESVVEKTPHAINIAVFRWRQRSLQLARVETAGAAEPCPTAKHVPPDLSEGEVAVRPGEHFIPILHRRHTPVEIVSSRARVSSDSTVAFAMLGGFRRPHYEVEIIQDETVVSHAFLLQYFY